MEIRNLITFISAAETTNFTRVAKILGYSQSAVTIQIRQLEKELGVKLFDRIGKRVTLTGDGEKFIPYAKKLLNDLEEAKNALKENTLQSGKIKLGIVESLLSAEFPVILTKFHREYPNISISITTGTIDYLIDLLQHNEIDMMYALDSQLYRENWIKAVNQPEKVVFIASANHPLVGKINVLFEEINKYDLILTEKDVSYRYVLEQKLLADGKSISPFLEVGNIEFIKRILLNEVGICYMPLYTVEKELREKLLYQIPCEKYEINIYKQLIFRKDKWINRSLNRLIEIICSNEKVIV
jgi:DNA-binding transcriptional LysR family regulator